MGTTYRAEHVGSLLRPRELLEARAARAEGRVSFDQLRELEDRSVLDALALQREAGIEIFTDGELRRENWMAALLEEIGGLVPVELPTGEGWHRDGGPDAAPDDVRFQMFAATEKVSRKSALSTVEAAFLAKHSPGQYKITMQSSSMGAMLWNPELSPAVYPSPDVLVQ